MPHRERRVVRSGAAGILGDARQEAELARLAQAFRAGGALSTQHDGGLGGASDCAAAASVQPEVAAQRARLRPRNIEPTVTEAHDAPGFCQLRRVRGDLHVVARQRHAALHARFVRMGDGQFQLKPHLRGAAGGRPGECVAHESRDRGAVHDRDRFAQRPAHFALHQHRRRPQVGNLRLRLELQSSSAGEAALGAPDLHAVAVEHQLAVELRQRGPHASSAREAARNVSVSGIAYVGRHSEFAWLAIAERKIAQVALDPELDAGRRALGHGLPDIVAGIRGDRLRQVPVHARPVGTAEAPLQVQHARKARMRSGADGITGVPAGLPVTLRIGIGELQARNRHSDLVALVLPQHIGRELVERQHRLLEDARQVQRSLADVDTGFTTGLGQVELHHRTPHSGAADRWPVGRRVADCDTGARSQLELGGAPLGFVGEQRVQRALPPGLD